MRALHVRALMQAGLCGARLAKGRLHSDDAFVDARQDSLLELARHLGPVFKIWWHGKITTCIVGTDRCRALLRGHSGDLRVDTVDFTGLFAHGFLRAMEGEVHAKAKQQFLRAVKTISLNEAEAELAALFGECLDRLAAHTGGVSEAQLARTVKDCATGMMIRLVYGVDPHGAAGTALIDAHDAYVPNGTPVVIRERERRAFAEIRRLVTGLLADGTQLQPSLLRALSGEAARNATVLGNLVQMVEFGRYDTHGLWRWIVHFLAQNQAVCRAIATQRDAAARRQLARRCVMETLRLEQSEALMRIVVRPFVFGGVYFPARSRIRLCIWESHKDAALFAEPFRFDPDRFLDGAPGDAYAPLGLDHHKCLGSGWTFDIGALFVESVACRFELEPVRAAPEVMGHFHFEPGAQAMIRFIRRPRALAPDGTHG